MSTTQLDPAQLGRIRRLIEAALSPTGSSIPMAELIALSQELSASVGLTIDLPSTSALGYPVVVVRPGRVEHSVAFSRLSPREHEVAALMAEGLRNKQIGERLSISLPTVKDHVHHILDKTGMTSRAAVAVAYSLHAR